jgi:hypothetical protein
MPLPIAAIPPPLDLPGPAPWPIGEIYPIEASQVETFDPAGRARLIAELLPRLWSGSYRPFGGPADLPVALRVETATPVGQIVELRGRLKVGEAIAPVLGTINAKSDQLDLLLLNEETTEGLEPGVVFQGLQGLSLSGLQMNRLTEPGGRLQLAPQAPAQEQAETGGTIRGLW